MLSSFKKCTIAGLSVLIAFLGQSALAAVPTLILVDKKTNTLKFAEYYDEGYKILKTYRATVGKVQGDKADEDDLKTPEGIYFFTARLTPPSLKPKFGVMAFYMDYPNSFDRIAGHTGFDIMLHATNEPERLKKDFDSQGCIVIKSEELEEIKPNIRLKLSPILVFSELTDDYLKPHGDPRLNEFFNSWRTAWENRDIDKYIEHYHSGLNFSGKDRQAWKAYKASLNKRYAKIQVNVEKIQFFRHPKYSVIMLVQHYKSQLKNGRTGFQSNGTKTLFVAEENGQLKIIDEQYTPGMW